MKQSFLLYIFVVLVAFSATGCGKDKSLDRLSPKEVVDLYYNARDNGDIELLQQIIYSPSGISGSQEKAKSALTGADEKGVMRVIGAKTKAEYEKILDDHTAEVGVVIAVGFPGFKKRIPYAQIILKHDGETWKYHYSKWELTKEKLTENLRNNPQETSWYYHMGTCIQSENPAKAHRFFKKYYDLEPDGFWVCKEFLYQLNKFENVEEFQKKMLNELPNVPVGTKATIYLTLGQFCVEHEDYSKAKEYFNKAKEGLKSYPSPIGESRLGKAKEELKLRLEGNYRDLLTEIEQTQEN